MASQPRAKDYDHLVKLLLIGDSGKKRRGREEREKEELSPFQMIDLNLFSTSIYFNQNFLSKRRRQVLPPAALLRRLVHEQLHHDDRVSSGLMDGMKIREEKEIKRDGNGNEEKRRRKTRPRPPPPLCPFPFLSFFSLTSTPSPSLSLPHLNRIDFKIKKVLLDGQSVKLQIWDTAGQERFRTITASYYRGAMGILLVYDVGDRRSFESVRGWMRAVESNAVDGVVRVSDNWSFFEGVSERGRKKEEKSVVKKRRAVYSLPSFSTLFCAFFLKLSFFSFSLSLLAEFLL